jgi:hypothetical protein
LNRTTKSEQIFPDNFQCLDLGCDRIFKKNFPVSIAFEIFLLQS